MYTRKIGKGSYFYHSYYDEGKRRSIYLGKASAMNYIIASIKLLKYKIWGFPLSSKD